MKRNFKWVLGSILNILFMGFIPLGAWFQYSTYKNMGLGEICGKKITYWNCFLDVWDGWKTDTFGY